MKCEISKQYGSIPSVSSTVLNYWFQMKLLVRIGDINKVPFCGTEWIRVW